MTSSSSSNHGDRHVRLRNRAVSTDHHSSPPQNGREPSNDDDHQDETAADRARRRRRRRDSDRFLQTTAASNAATRHEFQSIQASMKTSLGAGSHDLVRILILMLVVGLTVSGYVLYQYPTVVYRHVTTRLMGMGPPGVPFPPRRILTLYPRSVHIAQQLPRFFRNYAIATPDNAVTRRVIRTVQALREKLTASTYKINDVTKTPADLERPQPLYLYAWEHEDFFQQLRRRPQGGADSLCGQGYQAAYDYWEQRIARLEKDDSMLSVDQRTSMQRRSSSSADRDRQDDLVTACLLWAQKHDGVVRWNLQVLRPLIPHGLTGVAVQYYNDDQGRIYRPLLLLPLKAPPAGTGDIKTHLPTGHLTLAQSDVPSQMLSWMVQTQNWATNTVELDSTQYGIDYERFLYRAIRKEEATMTKNDVTQPPLWKWYTAVCDPITRAAWSLTSLRVATECEFSPTDELLRSDHNDAPPEAIDHQRCCDVFDPTAPPRPKRRHDDDERDQIRKPPLRRR